jgi:hypothetical protein
MAESKINDLLKNWDNYNELEMTEVLREFTDNYNPFLAEFVIEHYRKDDFEKQIRNLNKKYWKTKKTPKVKIFHDRIGDVFFIINGKEYPFNLFNSTFSKILRIYQLGNVIDDFEKEIKKNRKDGSA